LYLNGTQVLQYTDLSPILSGTALFEPRSPGVYLHPGQAAETATTGMHVSAFVCEPFDAATATNTYQFSTLSTKPYVVDYNGTYCFQGVGPNSLNNNEWYWYGNTLYFRNDAGAPSDGSVVVANKNNCLSATGKSGLTIQNIAVEHAIQPAFNFSACPNLTLQNCYGQRTSYSSSAVHG